MTVNYELPFLRVQIGSWSDNAKCKGMDPRVFHPDQGGNYRAALNVCAACPVTQECLDYAVANRLKDGIFGGQTPNQRAGWAALDLCRWCGAQFDLRVARNGKGARYCSDECRTEGRARSQRRHYERRRSVA